MKIEIEKITNGYIISEEDEGVWKTGKEVIEEIDDDDKFSENNLNINFNKKGHKLD